MSFSIHINYLLVANVFYDIISYYPVIHPPDFHITHFIVLKKTTVDPKQKDMSPSARRPRHLLRLLGLELMPPTPGPWV